MITAAMCFSIMQVPRCRIHAIAGSCWGAFHSLSRTGGKSFSFKVLGCDASKSEAHSRRWVRRSTTTKTGGNRKSTLSSVTSDISPEISDVTTSISTSLNINKTEIAGLPAIRYCDIRQSIAENKDLASLITVIPFDIETTGFGKAERIIEFAAQDLKGGRNSTFQTLVNPERYVPNSHIHGISTHMVNRPDIPRMKELIPILLQFIKSRQKPNGYVLLIAHNGRSFDVPFLIKEFCLCGFEIPPDWLFLDTIPLAREAMKLTGSKLAPKVSLQALREYYDIPLVGSAHRAMSDVYSLSLILQRMTFDLKLPVSGLVERSFTASDLIKSKKKKS